MTGLIRSNLGHMAGGFCLMGGWAAIANWQHAWPAPAWAALTQGVMTAIITLGLKQMVEFLSHKFPGWTGLIMPPVVACAISVGLLYSVHSLFRTPEVWVTLLVPASVSTLYAATYAAAFRRTS